MEKTEPRQIARYLEIHVFRSSGCALYRDVETRAPVLAMRRMRGAGDYEDYYRISEEEAALFLEDRAALDDFARRVERRALEDRLIPPQQPVFASPTGPRFVTMLVNRADRYALEREVATGAPVFSIPVANTMVDYCEYYRLSEDEFRALIVDKSLARDFAQRCGRREMDERLIFQPGSDRGFY